MFQAKREYTLDAKYHETARTPTKISRRNQNATRIEDAVTGFNGTALVQLSSSASNLHQTTKLFGI